MIRYYLFSLLFICNITFSQAQDRYVVRFTDKHNSAFSVNQPQQYLSQRAIARRSRFNIAIDESDLPVNSNYVQGVAATGAAILNVSKWFNAVIVESADPLVLTAINQLPYVVSTVNVGRLAAINGKKHKNKFENEEIGFPPFASNSELRSSSFNYNHSYNQISMIGINAIHDLGFSGDGVIIAVLDGGFQDADLMYCFDSLFTQNRVISTYDFVNHETNVYNDNYHGSAVLSCMAANVPGEYVGTAPHAKYILLVSEDTNSENIIEEYNWSVAAEYADSSGADLITTSLGYTTFDNSAYDHTYSDLNGNTCPSSIAADLASKKGILVVASAGNEGGSPWHYVGAPGEADSVLTVGAVDSLGRYASFSSTGPTADRRIKPDVADQGLQTWLYTPGSTQPGTGSGTSFSAPILAGAAACLLQAWPDMSNMDVIDAIKRSASQYNNPDSLLGYGIPDFRFANNLLSLHNYNLQNFETMQVFPNPWNGTDPLNIFFYSDTNQKAELTVMDMCGKIVLKQNTELRGGGYSQLQLNQFLSSGMYLIRIKSNDGTFVKRFIKST